MASRAIASMAAASRTVGARFRVAPPPTRIRVASFSTAGASSSDSSGHGGGNGAGGDGDDDGYRWSADDASTVIRRIPDASTTAAALAALAAGAEDVADAVAAMGESALPRRALSQAYAAKMAALAAEVHAAHQLSGAELHVARERHRLDTAVAEAETRLAMSLHDSGRGWSLAPEDGVEAPRTTDDCLMQLATGPMFKSDDGES
uniref:Uncharacterized protein n=1 Tax=Bicosoecida sp. CB-2014 TaxID=1486930 RepID=A0A7S1G5B7_9STRA|mmetsp:Transcript_12511/g.43780  ORF Transcript_12511/g.43780 Transcript_12511/m.43780 type:complete len:205 (+) Transcript_12511:79-693(+)